MEQSFNFANELAFSKSDRQTQADIRAILITRFTALSVDDSTVDQDVKGIDLIVRRPGGKHPIFIDAKIRREDFVKKFGLDDLALETWSKTPETGSRIGWTRDFTKHTDWVMWYWANTRRYCLVPFPPLCCVFAKHWEEWRYRFKPRLQDNVQWFSECIMVPRILLLTEIRAWENGLAEREPGD